KAREIDVEIENQQLILDRSETRPRVEAFTGYELYSENDPLVGPEFNHGYIVGLNASWHIFDGFATRGRMQATTARRDAALARLARACAREPQALDFAAKTKTDSSGKPIAEVMTPPSTLGGAR